VEAGLVWQEVDPGQRDASSSAGAEGEERNVTPPALSALPTGLHHPPGALTTWTLRLPIQTCVFAAGDDQVIRMRNYGTGLTPVVAIRPGTIEYPALSPATSPARHPLPHFQPLQRFQSTYTWSGVSQATPPQYSA